MLGLFREPKAIFGPPIRADDVPALPQIITALSPPSMGTLANGDAPADEVNLGIYNSTAGDITTRQLLVSVNGGAEGDGTAPVSQGDSVTFRVLVSDNAGTPPRSFGIAAQTVPLLAPTVTAAQADLSGRINDAADVTIDLNDVFTGQAMTFTIDPATTLDAANYDLTGDILTVSFDAVSTGNIVARATNSGGTIADTFEVAAVANVAPVAVTDTASTAFETAVVISVLDNDTDLEDDTLTVATVTQGSDGTVTTNGTTVTYTPDTGFDGADSFTYTISDGQGGTDTGTVNVTVAAENVVADLSALTIAAQETDGDVPVTYTINIDSDVEFVLTTSATTPTAVQIAAGQDHTGATAPDSFTSALTVSGSPINAAITATDLDDDYYLHGLPDGGADGDAITATGGPITIDTTVDTVSSIADVSDDGAATVTWSVNDTGTGYTVWVEDGGTVPNAAQVIAGTDGDDVAADDADTVTVTTTGAQTAFAATLTNGTLYNRYTVFVDTVGNTTAVLSGTVTPSAGVRDIAVILGEAAGSSTYTRTDDVSFMAANSDNTGSVSSDADPIGYVSRRSGTFDLLQAAATNRPQWNETEGALQAGPAAAPKWINASYATRSTNTCVVMRVKAYPISDNSEAMLFANQSVSADEDHADIPWAGTGKQLIRPVRLDGSLLAPTTTWGNLSSLLIADDWHTVTFLDIDTTDSDWADVSIFNDSAGTLLNSQYLLKGITIVNAPTAGDVVIIENEMSAL